MSIIELFKIANIGEILLFSNQRMVKSIKILPCTVILVNTNIFFNFYLLNFKIFVLKH